MTRHTTLPAKSSTPEATRLSATAGLRGQRPEDRIVNKSEVASLTIDSFRAMSRDELLDVIVAGKFPVLNDERIAQLQQAERRTLESLARQARRCCRQQGY